MTVIKRENLNAAYEIFISVLALLATVIAFLDLIGKISIESSLLLYWIDLSILIIFTIDYFTRLIIAKNKKDFFIHNLLDLIAILPFNSIFRALRIARLFKLARLSKIARFARLIVFSKKFTNKVEVFLHTNGFIYILYVTITLVLTGSVGIYFAEMGQSINSFGDAIWWSFVTTTTVGYGDISPKTTLGRVIAAVLMITGIGFIGMLTGTIATYFLGKSKPKEIVSVEQKTINVSDLNEEQYKQVVNFICYIKSNDK
jgi:voltage-gated potassium channel